MSVHTSITVVPHLCKSKKMILNRDFSEYQQKVFRYQQANQEPTSTGLKQILNRDFSECAYVPAVCICH